MLWAIVVGVVAVAVAVLYRLFKPIEDQRRAEIAKAQKITGLAARLAVIERALEENVPAKTAFSPAGSAIFDYLKDRRPVSVYLLEKGEVSALLLPLTLPSGYFAVLTEKGEFMMITPREWRGLFSVKLARIAEKEGFSLPRPHEVLVAIATELSEDLEWAVGVLGQMQMDAEEYLPSPSSPANVLLRAGDLNYDPRITFQAVGKTLAA